MLPRSDHTNRSAQIKLVCAPLLNLLPGELVAKKCSHLDQIQTVTPRANGCEQCLRAGDEWEHLRLCLTCGHVGCCDDSKNTHATAPFHSTGHPVIESLEPGEGSRWCYLDEIPLAAEIKEAALAYEGDNVMRDDTQHQTEQATAGRGRLVNRCLWSA